MPSISSDHSLVILCPSPKGRCGRQFKYEAYWEEHEECGTIVKEGWHNPTIEGDVWRNLLVKSKRCKRHLQTWNHRTFRPANEEIKNMKRQLNGVLNQNASDINWTEVVNLKNKIADLWKQEEIY